MKGFMKEFKEFISKGDVVSMAVGIIIGSAFTAIVTSLVEDIITPLIGIIIGGIDFSGMSVQVVDASVMYGSFIQAVINFLLTAFVLFLIIKVVSSVFNRKKKEEEAAPAPDPAEVVLLKEIRDLLKEQSGKE